ncbi:sensor histidine kinase [Novosphingobium aquimarinum]|uniref:sensor histidine kinase n=1 Tax=Novosphingobium aquimarinum TaxID=2682494 RepID=UPI0012EBDE89|nr:histidine kinase dimerization/phosphoacceptor domain -containing protein [Novosphingobium aquimarinum]
MRRLAHFDISRRVNAPLPRLATQVGFGLVCGLAMIALRTFLDIWFPVAGPFALVYPTVLLATLYGHWQAGLVAWAVSFGWAWYVVLPFPHSFEFAEARDIPRVTLNAASALIVLVFAETFRSAVESGRLQSDAEIERRAILLAEMEHRTKNNFALVASLLEIQKRRESSETVRFAFDDAIGRVRTFAEAYSHLADEQGEGAHVEMKPYLQRLVERVGSAAFPPNVTVTHEISDVSMARETAVAIGLFTNEALTNCAKYAFPDSRAGAVHVALDARGDEWSLSIRDDGTGTNADPVDKPDSGIGSSLLGAFARQAGAAHVVHPSDRGFTVELTSAK